MQMSKLLRWILLVFGAAIIVAIEILFRGDLEDKFLVMNIIVSLIVWGVLFAGIGFPWIDLDDKSQKRVGSLGLYWLFSSLYAFLAVVCMIVGTQLGLSFEIQLIVHLILLFILAAGLAMAWRASDKVKEVYEKETELLQGVVDIRQAFAVLKESTYDANGLPEEVVDRISKMCDEARFMSPSNNPEARAIESQIVSLTEAIGSAFFDYRMNEESIQQKLAKCERLLKSRKQIHSN